MPDKCERCRESGFDPDPASLQPGTDGACRDCAGNGTVETDDEWSERMHRSDPFWEWSSRREPDGASKCAAATAVST